MEDLFYVYQYKDSEDVYTYKDGSILNIAILNKEDEIIRFNGENMSIWMVAYEHLDISTKRPSPFTYHGSNYVIILQSEYDYLKTFEYDDYLRKYLKDFKKCSRTYKIQKLLEI